MMINYVNILFIQGSFSSPEYSASLMGLNKVATTPNIRIEYLIAESATPPSHHQIERKARMKCVSESIAGTFRSKIKIMFYTLFKAKLKKKCLLIAVFNLMWNRDLI